MREGRDVQPRSRSWRLTDGRGGEEGELTVGSYAGPGPELPTGRRLSRPAFLPSMFSNEKEFLFNMSHF